MAPKDQCQKNSPELGWTMSTRLTRKVADKNAFRSGRCPQLFEFLRKSKNHHLMIPESMIVESLHGQNREQQASNFLKDFQNLEPFYGQLFLLKAPVHLNSSFNWNSKGLQHRLISHKDSQAFQRYIVTTLENIKRGTLSPGFLEGADKANARLSGILESHQSYLEYQRIMATVPGVTSEDWETFKKTHYFPERPLALLIQAVVSQGYTLPIPYRLHEGVLIANCFAFRFTLAYNLLALERRACGKQVNFPLTSNVIKNDAMDMLYVAHASYFDGYFCNEKRSEKIYNMLTHLLKNPALIEAINHFRPDPKLIKLALEQQV